MSGSNKYLPDDVQIKYVTAMSRKIYETIGHRMISSWHERWPEGILEVYAEEEIPRFYSDSRIVLKSLHSVPGFSDFDAAVSRFSLLCGQTDKGYNYRYNLRDFSKKVFAQISSAQGWEQILVWLDADVVTLHAIERSNLLDVCDGNFISYLGRREYSICTSFLAWDNSICGSSDWWSNYARYYKEGYVFRFDEWHDAYVMSKLILSCGLPTRDLSPREIPVGPVNIFDIVFEPYARHFKGDLKAPFLRGKRYDALYSWLTDKRFDRVLEIGVGNADNAVKICRACDTKFYVGVDLFEDGNLAYDEKSGNLTQRISLEFAGDRIREDGIEFELFKGDSANVLIELIENGFAESFDFVFVDGSKERLVLESDLRAAFRLVKNGGEIGINGYCVGRQDGARFGDVGCVNELVGGLNYSCLPQGDPVSEELSIHIAVIRVDEPGRVLNA